MVANDQFDLQRFVDAQDQDGTFDRALGELRAGRKSSHWIWFVFPQIDGLGRSLTARKYAISSLAEAKAYLGHPVLGPRLIEAARALTGHAGLAADRIVGEIDASKLRSSMTLFTLADSAEPVFREVLDLFFDGDPDPHTERIVAA